MSSLRHLKKDHYGFNPYSVCDIEARSWTKFLLIGHFDGVNYRHFNRLKEFFRYIASHPHTTIYAHFGGIFDFMHLLDYLVKSSTWTPIEIVPVGSTMLCLKAEHESGKTVEFRDSARMLSYGLGVLTKTFDVKHKKLVDTLDVANLTEVTPEVIRYNEHDCRGLHEVIEAYFSWDLISKAGPAPTIAGQAMRIMRQFLPEGTDLLRLGNKVDEFVREAYISGRTEIYRPVWPPTAARAGEKLNCYDVNSLFPYCMSQDMPGNFRYSTKEYEPNEMGVYDATVYVPEDTYIPILGQKMETPDGHTKLVFPTGTFKGRWTTMELEYAKTVGVKVLKTGRGRIFQNLGPIFAPFIHAVHEIKLAAGKRIKAARDAGEPDPVEALVNYMLAKTILNSCYGRTGILREKTAIVFDEGREGWTEIKLPKPLTAADGREVAIGEVPTEYRGFSNVAMAAWVTARARIHMHKLMREIDFDVYYTDTDSIYTPRELETGEALGELKLVDTYTDAVFLLPKTYVARNDKKTDVHMKGIPWKVAQAFKVEDFRDALEGQIKLVANIPPRMARLKEALRRYGTILAMVDASKKEVRAVYSKRELFENNDGWNSRPLIIKKKKGKNNAVEKEKHPVSRLQRGTRARGPATQTPDHGSHQ